MKDDEIYCPDIGIPIKPSYCTTNVVITKAGKYTSVCKKILTCVHFKNRKVK